MVRVHARTPCYPASAHTTLPASDAAQTERPPLGRAWAPLRIIKALLVKADSTPGNHQNKVPQRQAFL